MQTTRPVRTPQFPVITSMPLRGWKLARGAARSRVSCCVVVLVDQSTEDVAAARPAYVRPVPRLVPSGGTGVAWIKPRCGRRRL